MFEANPSSGEDPSESQQIIQRELARLSARQARLPVVRAQN
jgi:hypothetical protein